MLGCYVISTRAPLQLKEMLSTPNDTLSENLHMTYDNLPLPAPVVVLILVMYLILKEKGREENF